MEEKLKKAIESIADKIADENNKLRASEVQQYAQAALNLANALIGIKAQK